MTSTLPSSPTQHLQLALIPAAALLIAASIDIQVETHPASGEKVEVEALAPEGVSKAAMRQALLVRADQTANQAGRPCYRIERESWATNVKVVDVPSGRLTLELGEGSAEWHRYWQLYRHRFPSAGQQEPGQTTSHTIGRMRIALLSDPCPAEALRSKPR